MGVTARYQSVGKIDEKKELLEQLKKYRDILSVSMYDYLNELLSLEISALGDYITKDTRSILSDIRIYRQIVRYNIYSKAINLFEKEKDNIGNYIINDDNSILLITGDDSTNYANLFMFDYADRIFNSIVDDEYKNMRIGNIDFFKTVESNKVSKEDLEIIKKEFERIKIKAEKSRYTANINYSHWSELGRLNTVGSYQKFLMHTANTKDRNIDIKKTVELTEYVNKLLLEEFDVKKNSFKEWTISSNNTINGFEVNKTNIKKMPNLTIRNNIKYI